MSQELKIYITPFLRNGSREDSNRGFKWVSGNPGPATSIYYYFSKDKNKNEEIFVDF